MIPIARTAVLCLLAACASAPPAAAPPAPAPAPAPAPTPAPVELAQLGTPCSAACTAPATCATYYGIAGPSGPAFTSCELACADEPAACPTGTRCVTIADGPGAVCRKVEP